MREAEEVTEDEVEVMPSASSPSPVMSLDEIAESFISNNRDVIIKALQHMMWIQAQRLKMGLKEEKVDMMLSGKVSSLMNSMFANAIKIAKLVDPRPTDRSLIQVGVQVNNTTSNELVARAFADLMRAGYQREDITPDLVEEHIAGQLLAGPPVNG